MRIELTDVEIDAILQVCDDCETGAHIAETLEELLVRAQADEQQVDLVSNIESRPSDIDQLAGIFESRGFPLKKHDYTLVIGTFPNEILFSFDKTKSVQAVWSRENANGPAVPSRIVRS